MIKCLVQLLCCVCPAVLACCSTSRCLLQDPFSVSMTSKGKESSCEVKYRTTKYAWMSFRRQWCSLDMHSFKEMGNKGLPEVCYMIIIHEWIIFYTSPNFSHKSSWWRPQPFSYTWNCGRTEEQYIQAIFCKTVTSLLANL